MSKRVDKWLLDMSECFYIPATSIVPRAWDRHFWESISDNAPFSWGDNNHSLVKASDFANHCAGRLDDCPAVKAWLRDVRKLGDTYIDLEN